jgi:hypothetical protein
MGPRITINLTADGEFQIWLNEEGRDLLVRELQRLNERDEHFHLMPKDMDGHVPTSSRPYHPSDKVLEWGKVLFRTDDWDKEHYPHVMRQTD